jgi:phenylacetate-CoA ligase
MAMEDYKTSVLLTTASYAMHILDVMKRLGKEATSLVLKTILVVGEALTDTCRDTLQSTFLVDVLAGYGPSDVMPPGVAFECEAKNGLHINEDHFLLEIVDPESGVPCPPGKEGEIVLTTLTAKAFPLIRFRTGDLAYSLDRSCACERTFSSISAVTGFTGDVLTIRGVKVHPVQIEQILAGAAGEKPPRFFIHLYKESHLDMVEIWLEMTEQLFSDEVKGIEQTVDRLQKAMFQLLGLQGKIKLMEAATMDRLGMDSGGVIDDR